LDGKNTQHTVCLRLLLLPINLVDTLQLHTLPWSVFADVFCDV